MALELNEKLIAATLAQRNPEPEYMIRLSGDEVFAREQIAEKKEQLKEDLLKEKNSHETHISHLQSRLEKISTLLQAIGE